MPWRPSVVKMLKANGGVEAWIRAELSRMRDSGVANGVRSVGMAKAQTDGMQGPIAHTYIAVVDPTQTRTFSYFATLARHPESIRMSSESVGYLVCYLCTYLCRMDLGPRTRQARPASPRPHRAPSQPVRTPRDIGN